MNNKHCPHCHVGKLSLKRTTTFPVIDNKTLMVPNVPIWQCDVCAWSKFQPQVAAWLDSMLNAQNGLKPVLKTGDNSEEKGIWKII